MDKRTPPIAVTALALAAILAGPARPALAPLPTPQAAEQLQAITPKPGPARPLAVKASAADRECLAMAIYWEARGETEAGKAAVAHVTLNRVGADSFPASICGVVRQGGSEGPCQFGWYCDGRPDDPTDPAAWAEARTVADRVLAGLRPDPTGGALYFHGRHEHPQWGQSYASRKVIGNHVFLRLKDDGVQTAESR